MSNEKQTVMLVDDDIDYLNLVRMQLESSYRIIMAQSVAEAEALLKSDPPQVAIIDLMMENMDAGFVLCHRIKRDHPTIPVIMVTAVTSETGMEFDGDRDKNWLKADALLAKPTRAEQLVREIKRLTGDAN